MTIFGEIIGVIIISLIISVIVSGIKNSCDKHVSRSINDIEDEDYQDKYAKRFITVFLYNIQKALENKDVINCRGVYKIFLKDFYCVSNGFDLSKPFEKIIHEIEKYNLNHVYRQRYFNVTTWRDRYINHNDWNPETIKYVSDKLWNEYNIHILNVSDLEIDFVRRSEYNNLCPELQEQLHYNDPERFPEVAKGFMVTILTLPESDENLLAKVKRTFYSTKAFAEAYPEGIYPEHSIVEQVYGNYRRLIHHYKDLSPKGEYIEIDGS